jgi:hypothetical protein
MTIDESRMLKIDETSSTSGGLAPVFLRFEGEALEIIGAGSPGALALPSGALEAVMSRYGAPFDHDAPIAAIAHLDLDGGRRLRHVRHLAGYDVIARDYLVYDAPGAEPLCALATQVATALAHLARARAAGRS